MIKYLNLPKIIFVVIVLIAVHFGVGMFLSPYIKDFAVAKINEYSKAKVTLGQMNIWPLTLSVTAKDLRVFDPDNPSQRIVRIADVSARLSAFGLLSRRLVFSSIYMNDAEISVCGEPDGTFNIQKLARPKQEAKKIEPGQVIDAAIKNKDWFTRAYGLLKNKLAKQNLEKRKSQEIEAKKVTKEIDILPKGRRVQFKTASGNYLFEIKDLVLRNVRVDIKPEEGRSLEVTNARMELGNVAFDPVNGVRLGKFDIAGDLASGGQRAGSVQLLFDQAFSGNEQKTLFDVILKEVNLSALNFIYADSLPVDVLRGMLTLESKTSLTDDVIDSRNSIILSNHELAAKAGEEDSSGFMPTSMICDTLNKINPVQLSFEIGGTVEKPEFRGFKDSLMKLVMSNTRVIQEQIQSKAFEAIGNYFKKKKKSAEPEPEAPAPAQQPQPNPPEPVVEPPPQAPAESVEEPSSQ